MEPRMADTPSTAPVDPTVDAAFAALIDTLRKYALDNIHEFDRIGPFVARATDMRGRFDARLPLNPTRPKTIAEVAAQAGG